MRETSNYKLSQWDKTDRIQMEDFNDNFLKIDAALQENREKSTENADQLVASIDTLEKKQAADMEVLRSENYWVKLKDLILERDSAAFSCPLENAEDYAEMKCLFTLEPQGRLQLDLNNGVDLMLGDRTGTYQSISILSSACPNGAGGSLSIQPLGGTGNVVIFTHTAGVQSNGNSQEGTYIICSHTLLYPSLTSLDFSTSSGVIKAGGRLRLYGLKK